MLAVPSTNSSAHLLGCGKCGFVTSSPLTARRSHSRTSCRPWHRLVPTTRSLHTWLWTIIFVSDWAQILIKNKQLDKTHVQQIQGRHFVPPKKAAGHELVTKGSHSWRFCDGFWNVFIISYCPLLFPGYSQLCPHYVLLFPHHFLFMFFYIQESWLAWPSSRG